jgi:FkbM family methyltransferase
MPFLSSLGPLGYLARTLLQDVAILRLALPRRTRLALIAAKYRALAQVAAGREATLAVGDARLAVQTLFNVGLYLFNIVTQVRILTSMQLPSKPVIVDAGANIGQFCSAAKLVWPGASVLSIEADPATAKQLTANTRLLSGVTVRAVGIAAEEGELPWFPQEHSVLSSFRPRFDEVEVAAGDTLHVEPLDKITAGLSRIDLLKIDVEGYEYEALQGGRETLARTGWLMIEAGLLGDHSALEVLSLLHEIAPEARLADVGLPYAPHDVPECVDMLIELSPPTTR